MSHGALSRGGSRAVGTALAGRDEDTAPGQAWRVDMGQRPQLTHTVRISLVAGGTGCAQPPVGPVPPPPQAVRAEERSLPLSFEDGGFQKLFESVYEAGILTDLSGDVVSVNVHAEEFLRCTEDALRGASICRVVEGADAALVQAVCEHLREERLVLIEAECRRLDGTTFPAEIAVNEFGLGGRSYLCFLVRNTEEHERDAAALRESEERYRTLVEAMNEGLSIIDREGTLTYVNDRLCQMLGQHSEELVGRRVTDLLDGRNAQILLGQLARREQGRSDPYELNWLRRDGSKLSTLMSPRGLYDSTGRLVGSFSTITDITHQKETEARLQEALAELESSNRDLEQFAYVASHDLQEPLRMVASYVELLARRYKGKLDADADDFIAFAVDGARRMQGLINDLLAFSRVSRQGGTLEPVSSADALAMALGNLRAALDESGAEVSCDELPVVVADRTQLTQLFQNLISNAVKFRGDRSPRVYVSARRADSPEPAGDARAPFWQFVVSDNGIGIEPRFAERIFVIFQRLHGREEYPGTGIGLAICKRIIERHGGRIWLESEPGAGSSFCFTLPAAEE